MNNLNPNSEQTGMHPERTMNAQVQVSDLGHEPYADEAHSYRGPERETDLPDDSIGNANRRGSGMKNMMMDKAGSAEEFLANHPWQTVAVSFGLGLGLGLLARWLMSNRGHGFDPDAVSEIDIEDMSEAAAEMCDCAD
jgi:hypothetical protein